MSRLDRLLGDCVEVYRWNPRLYRRVLTFGYGLGFLLGTTGTCLGVLVAWILLR